MQGLKQQRMRRILVACAAFLGAASGAGAPAAEPAPALLGGLFQDHAVLQRDRPIPVWGRAEPGETVTIEFAGTRTRVRADRSGRWSASLPAQRAGGPYQLIASTARGARETLQDVMVGDVWLCSGQSNMEFGVGRALNAPTEIGSSADDGIRLLTIARDTGLTPVDAFRASVAWQTAGPSTVGEFSAACYFMGRDLRASQKVPIGLVDSSWGGSAIDAWRSEEAIQKGGGLDDRLAVLRAYRVDPAEGNRRWGALWENWWRSRTGDKQGSEPWTDAGARSGDWKPVPRLTNWESWGDPALASYNGMMWYRTSFTLTAEQAAKPAILDIGWADDLDQSWVNGVPVGNTNGPGSSRAYAIPPGLLKAGANSVVVNVLDTYSGGGLIGPEELRALRFGDGTKVPLTTGWTYKVAQASAGWPPRAPWEAIAGLSTLYNAMIAPLGPYGLRGIAWYQGESDASTERGYARKLGSLMLDWRKQFRNPELAFLVAQLANWGPPNSAPQESGTATTRDEQRLAVAANPNAGLAVTIDLGEPNDIHPANKQDVGHRLARAARKVAYREAVTAGPQPVAARRAGDSVTVEFRDVDGELVSYSSARVIGFELCGEAVQSCRFVDARAAGSTATLAAGGGPASRVRFCWGDSPVCNLYDRGGLPAGPFELQVR